eukprot:2851135-Alexandrium_andersonii.AAC.1
MSPSPSTWFRDLDPPSAPRSAERRGLDELLKRLQDGDARPPGSPPGADERVRRSYPRLFRDVRPR